jgi:tetratricopeptide (TPR) repeat protein
VLNFLFSLGITIAMVILFSMLKISLWAAIPAGLIGGIALFIYLGRKIQGKLQLIFNRASEGIKRQQFDHAIEIMKEGYQFSRWQFLVKGSIDGQIGILYYLRKKINKAEPLLRSASFQHYVAKAMLATILWKRGDKKESKKVFQTALKYGKKESLLYAVYAYVLNEMKERDKAIEILNQGLKICKSDERLLMNRNNLQNNRPMKMKVFGDQWYQFMIERPMLRQEQPPFANISKRAIRG